MSTNVYKNIAEKNGNIPYSYKLLIDQTRDLFLSDIYGYIDAVRNLINSDENNEFKVTIAHQPVFFPYESIVVNYLLMGYLSNQYKNQPKAVSSNHIILDMDIGSEPRFRNVRIPSYVHKHGSFPITMAINKSERHKPVMLINSDINNVEKEIQKILKKLLMEGEKLGISFKEKNRINANYLQLVDYLKTTRKIENISNYNTLSSKIFANDIYNSNTKFIYFSEMLMSMKNYETTLKEVVKLLNPSAEKVQKLYCSLDIPIPKSLINFIEGEYFWGFCKFCFTRNSLYKFNTDFQCSKCRRNNKLSFATPFHKYNSKVVPSIVPKVILEEYIILFIFNYSSYQAHSGGAEHIIVSNLLYKFSKLKPKPTLLWSPHARIKTISSELYNKYKSVNESAVIAESLLINGRTSWIHSIMSSGIENYHEYWEKAFQSSEKMESY